MSQISDIQSYSLEDILKILHSEAQKMPLSPTSLRYIRALESLTATSCISRKEHRGDGDAEEKEAQAPLPPQRPQREIPESADQESLACPPPLHPLREALGEWVVNMWLMGVPFTTASLNLDIISAIYGAAVKAGRLPAISLFSELKAQLKALGSEGWNSGINEEIFTRALRLTKNANRLLLDDSVAADLVILSLTHGLLPLEQLALLRRNSDPESHAKAAEEQRPQKEMNTVLFASLREMQEDQVLQQIIARHCPNARKKYVFPLNQSQRTATAIRKQVFNMTNALFRRARLPQSTDPNQTVEALWAYAALRIGIPASQVVTHLGHAPLGLPVLKLCKSSVLSLKSSVLSLKSSVLSLKSSESGQAAEVSDGVALQSSEGGQAAEVSDGVALQSSEGGQAAEESNTAAADTPNCSAHDSSPLTLNSYEESFALIGKTFLDNPPRWYALSLRPGVRFTQLCRRIELLLKTEDSRLKSLSSIQLFYPCEEIARAIGKKIVIRQRPFIHSVVFFRAKLTDIGPLLSKIGDLAWCYRQSARPGAPYAEISQQQFRLFQQTIATFTPDYEVASAGELELKPNDRVRIVGGLFAGHEANVVSTVPCASTHDKDNSSPSAASEDSRLKTEDFPTVYRLNIVGDNGIEWRIHADSRLLKHNS